MTTGPERIDGLPRAAAVLLARLLVARTPAAQAAVRKDVGGIFDLLDDAAWAAAVSAAVGAGLAEVVSPARSPRKPPAAKLGPMHLTGEGRTAARDRLGATADRPKLTANTIEKFWRYADPKPSAARVLLTRLYVPGKTVPSQKVLRTAVEKIVGPLDDDGWRSAVSSLVSAGYVNDPFPPPPNLPAMQQPATSGPLRLTDGGRAAASEWLGMETIPAKLTWPAVRDKWLPAATVPAADRAAFADDKRVVALLLGRALDVGPAATVDEAVEAAVCRDLGHPQVRRLDELISAVLGKRLGKSLPPLTAKQRAAQVPAVVFGVPKADARTLRSAAVKRWAGAEPALAPAAAAKSGGDDLPAFAAAVNAAAVASPTGRFGPNKVFISHVHRQLADGSPLDAFKRRLVEANTAGLVSLARADLVAAMDPVDVRESEARYLTAEFHFVHIEPGRMS